MKTRPRYYARPELTHHLVLSLRGELPFGDGSNGIFLAAPRRTGKTTFLREELAPALENCGITVIYVDLWSDDSRDPAGLVRSAIAEAIENAKGLLPKTARKLGVSSATLNGWVSFDTQDLGTTEGATLSHALQTLAAMTGGAIALIIDEAQQALVSKEGESTMRALKSARDTMNSPDETGLMLVMTGSDRDKLLRLTNTNASAFLGSDVQTMPMLGRDYVEAVSADIEAHDPRLAPVDVVALYDAFSAFGHRPQPFATAVGSALNPVETPHPKGFERGVLDRAKAQLAADRARMSADFIVLDPLAQAVLWRLLELRERFRPYDAEAIDFYRDRLEAIDSGRKLDAQAVQKAIRKLREGSPALVWKSARGEYAPQDSGMHEWYDALRRADAWPPGTQSME